MPWGVTAYQRFLAVHNHRNVLLVELHVAVVAVFAVAASAAVHIILTEHSLIGMSPGAALNPFTSMLPESTW